MLSYAWGIPLIHDAVTGLGQRIALGKGVQAPWLLKLPGERGHNYGDMVLREKNRHLVNFSHTIIQN